MCIIEKLPPNQKQRTFNLEMTHLFETIRFKQIKHVNVLINDRIVYRQRKIPVVVEFTLYIAASFNYLSNKIIFLNGSQNNVEGNKDKFISHCKHELIFY